MNVEIETDLVKEQLMFPNNENEKEMTIEHVAKATAQYFRLPLADLKSKGRNQDITKARHVAMYLARKVVNAKQQEIEKQLRNRGSELMAPVNPPAWIKSGR